MPYYAVTRNSFLSHHGILGQKWGIRRFQNKDGTLTDAGKKRRKEDPVALARERRLKETEKKLNDVRRAYKIKENAKQLVNVTKKLSDAREALIKDKEEYFERARKNPEQLQKDVKKAMETYIDDDELRELAQMELNEIIEKGGDLKNSWIADKAYTIRTAYDPEYLKKYTPFVQSLTELNTLSKDLAIRSYDSAGPKAMRNWSPGEINTKSEDGSPYTTRDNDIDMLAFLMREEAKKSK